MRTKETTSTRISRVEATQKQGRVRLVFFFFWFFSFIFFQKSHGQQRQFYFNKILLSSLPFCFILQSNRLREPDKLSGISQVVERSWENYAVRLAPGFSKQFVPHVKVRHRYVFLAFRADYFSFFFTYNPSWGRHAKKKSVTWCRVWLRDDP